MRIKFNSAYTISDICLFVYKIIAITLFYFWIYFMCEEDKVESLIIEKVILIFVYIYFFLITKHQTCYVLIPHESIIFIIINFAEFD